MANSKKVNDPDKKWYHIEGLTDKQMHLIVGYFLGILVSSIFGFEMWIIVTLVIAAGKEMYDLLEHGHSDYLDFIYTVAGSVLGALTVHLIKYILWTF